MNLAQCRTTFFRKYPELRGVADRGDADYAALCTSTSEVQQFLVGSLSSVFAAVPGLAGVFTITMSENLTNCCSKYQGQACPRCGKRSAAEVVSEVNRLISYGVRQAKPDAKVIVWDWGWPDEWAEDAIDLLPSDVWLASVGEWSLPIERGGIKSAVGEYTISAAGPGPRAVRHWKAAKKRGIKTIAKVQVNNTWELSAIPAIPAMQLVAENIRKLTKESIDGLLLSWTLGGYPSANLEVAKQYYAFENKAPEIQDAVNVVAENRFGGNAASLVSKAWGKFSAAFREFPFHIGVVYKAPLQVGPANLLFRNPTGYLATMVGIPYDDLDSWRAVYPPEVFCDQFRKMADGWQEGIGILYKACGKSPSANLESELRIAEAAYCHFRSVEHQIEFILNRSSDWPRCVELLKSEIEIAKKMFHIVNCDSRIGYEATNHYYYNRLDFVEKILNCRYLLENPTD